MFSSARKPTYLDYAATTPLDPRVLEAMLPFLAAAFGNPSSQHRYGQEAEAAVETARETVARILGCGPEEVVFTSGGSESDNLAVRGAALAAQESRAARHLLVSPIEHPAVLGTARQLARQFGFELELLPVDPAGRVDPREVAQRIRPETALVSVMYASNEIGTIEPIEGIGAACRQRGVPFHSDAVQAASQLPLRVEELGVDLLSLGAHKFYGPKGVGALYVRKGTALQSVQTGGGQERGLRAGTHNVPGIVGLARALEITAAELSQNSLRFADLRERTIAGVVAGVPEVQLTGHPSQRLPNHASFVIRGVKGDHLLTHLDMAGLACSSGSACKAGNPEPSEVLLALGYTRDWALGSLRVTVGRATEAKDIELLLGALPGICAQLRRMDAE